MKVMVLSASSLNTIQLCMRRFEYEKIRNLAPAHKADSLQNGDLMHQMLERFYQQRVNQISSTSQWTLSVEEYGTLLHECVQFGRELSIGMSLPIPVAERCIEVFKEYCVFYRADKWIPLYVESPFSFVLAEIPSIDLKILFEGKIDLVVKTPQGIALVDHKTRKKNVPVNHLSNQYAAYCIATGHNTAIQNNIGFQTSLKPEEKYTRDVVSYSKEFLAEWRSNAINWALAAYQATELGVYLPNYTSCDKWSGCPFREACEMSGLMRENILNREFVQREPHDLFATKAAVFSGPEIDNDN